MLIQRTLVGAMLLAGVSAAITPLSGQSISLFIKGSKAYPGASFANVKTALLRVTPPNPQQPRDNITTVEVILSNLAGDCAYGGRVSVTGKTVAAPSTMTVAADEDYIIHVLVADSHGAEADWTKGIGKIFGPDVTTLNRTGMGIFSAAVDHIVFKKKGYSFEPRPLLPGAEYGMAIAPGTPNATGALWLRRDASRWMATVQLSDSKVEVSGDVPVTLCPIPRT
jgi:hypothetical protein